MTLLDIGCGWGTTMKRAVEKYDVNVIGLTLSKNQHARAQQVLDDLDTDRSRQVLLRGWEDFSDPVDRIVSIEAFEHFGFENYDHYFKNTFNIMPEDGRMTVQSSVAYHPYDLNARGKKITFETARFIKFILTEIFPGGRLPSTGMMVEHGEKAGFVVPEPISLRRQLHQDPASLGRRAGGQQRQGHRDPVRRGLRALHEVPARLRALLRRRSHRRQPGHLPEAGRRRLDFFSRGCRIAARAVRRTGREWNTGFRSLPEVTTMQYLALLISQERELTPDERADRDGGLPKLPRQGWAGDPRR